MRYSLFTLILTILSLVVSACSSSDAPAAAGLTSTPAGYTLSGRVWLDADGDGLQDTGEAGLTGAPVRLLAGGQVVAETTTGTDGHFSFGEHPRGEYQLSFAAPPGFTYSPQDAGDDQYDSDADPNTGLVALVIPGQTEHIAVGVIPPGPGAPQLITIPAPTPSN